MDHHHHQTCDELKAQHERMVCKHPAPYRVYLPDEVSVHDSADDAWVILNGRVLDITAFLAQPDVLMNPVSVGGMAGRCVHRLHLTMRVFKVLVNGVVNIHNQAQRVMFMPTISDCLCIPRDHLMSSNVTKEDFIFLMYLSVNTCHCIVKDDRFLSRSLASGWDCLCRFAYHTRIESLQNPLLMFDITNVLIICIHLILYVAI